MVRSARPARDVVNTSAGLRGASARERETDRGEGEGKEREEGRQRGEGGHLSESVTTLGRMIYRNGNAAPVFWCLACPNAFRSSHQL